MARASRQSYKILTYDDIIPISSGENSEPLVDVQSRDNSIVAAYDKLDMVPYTGTRIYVRKSVAQKLAHVNATLQRDGFRLKVVYGYRHPHIQERYFATNKARLVEKYAHLDDVALKKLTHNFVAIPEIAGHPVGGTVDVTLMTADGKNCDMGTAVADFSDSEQIRTFAKGLSGEQQRLRGILHDAMVAQSFAPFYGEWWHFSYGDREWTAFYGEAESLYSPVDFSDAKLITAAGGNATAVQVIGERLTREQYARFGEELGDYMKQFGAEQAGFLVLPQRHFEMAGGEFCGNASRAAAILLAEELGRAAFDFSVSGFGGIVSAKVVMLSGGEYDVRCDFPGLSVAARREVLRNGQMVTIVDLGSIVHVVVDASFPRGRYERIHAQIVDELQLTERDAVGVIWLEQRMEGVMIHPVVWVRAIDSLFYETSCGSGSIAVAEVTGENCIIQPSGGKITVERQGDVISISGLMRLIR